MERVLVVSKSREDGETIKCVIAREKRFDFTLLTSARDARAQLSTQEYDLVILNCPLDSENGEDLALDFSQTNFTQVIVITKAEFFDEISAKLSAFGIQALSRPLSKAELVKAERFSLAINGRMKNINREKMDLKRKLKELATISRAKCVLIEYLKINEEEAHKYIERRAMDKRVSRLEVAESILRTYER